MPALGDRNGQPRDGTMASAPKLTLDFLLRPATIASRQHSGTELSIRRANPLKKRQHRRGAGGRDMAVWFSACSAENWLCFVPKSPSTPQALKHQQMTVETTCCARERVR